MSSEEQKLGKNQSIKHNPSLESSNKSQKLQSSKSVISSSVSNVSPDEVPRGTPRRGRFPSEVKILGYNNKEDDEEDKDHSNADNGSLDAQKMPYIQ